MIVRLPPFAPGQTIGLLGGSFNPPHEGHRLISELALRRLRLDRLWWLATPGNPLKPSAGLAEMRARIEAARRLTRDPRIAVTGFEAEIGARYTYETIAWLKRRAPGAHFVWIMGADNLRQFHLWRHWRAIVDLVPILVVDRPGSTLARAGRPRRRRSGAASAAGVRSGAVRPPAAAGVHVPARAALRAFPRRHCVRPLFRAVDRLEKLTGTDHLLAFGRDESAGRPERIATLTLTSENPAAPRRRKSAAPRTPPKGGTPPPNDPRQLGELQGRGYRRHRPRGQNDARRHHDHRQRAFERACRRDRRSRGQGLQGGRLSRSADRGRPQLRLGAARRRATPSSTFSNPTCANSTISKRCGARIVPAKRGRQGRDNRGCAWR